MTNLDLPRYNEIHWPLLIAVREIGSSGTDDELDQAVIEREGFSEGMGLLDNSARGIWGVRTTIREEEDVEIVPEFFIEPNGAISEDR